MKRPGARTRRQTILSPTSTRGHEAIYNIGEPRRGSCAREKGSKVLTQYSGAYGDRSVAGADNHSSVPALLSNADKRTGFSLLSLGMPACLTDGSRIANTQMPLCCSLFTFCFTRVAGFSHRRQEINSHFSHLVRDFLLTNGVEHPTHRKQHEIYWANPTHTPNTSTNSVGIALRFTKWRSQARFFFRWVVSTISLNNRPSKRLS